MQIRSIPVGVLVVAIALVRPAFAAEARLNPGSLNNVIQAQVVATRVTGIVTMQQGTTMSALNNNDAVPQGAVVAAGEKSNVALVFSNGTTAHVGANSALTIKQFLQDPFAATVKLAELDREPTVSKTELVFERGEVVVHLKRLESALGSVFLLHTPAGVAQPRGTLLRMKITPQDATTAEFRLEVMGGAVAFTPKHGPTVQVEAGQPYVTTIPRTQ